MAAIIPPNQTERDKRMAELEVLQPYAQQPQNPFNPSSLPPQPLSQSQHNFYSPPPPIASLSPYNPQLQLSPRQMLAAQQHFGSSLLPQQTNKQAEEEAAAWQTDEYDLFLKNLFDGNNTVSNHAAPGTDMDPAMSSFSGSHSHFSGNSDSGTSPGSFHDFVFGNGSNSFGTPPGSDVGSSSYGGRSASFSIQADAKSMGIEMDMSNGSFSDPFTGSDYAGTSPNMDSSSYLSSQPQPTFSIHEPTTSQLDQAISPYGASPATAINSNSQIQIGQSPSNWNTNFLAPSAAMSMQTGSGVPAPSSEGFLGVPTSAAVPPASSDTVTAGQVPSPDRSAPESRKRPAPTPSPDAPSRTSTVRQRQSKGETKPVVTPRATKKAKSAGAPLPAPTKTAPPSNRTMSSLPHMEVGSNATALAAIERLKAKRQKAADEAAAALLAAKMSGGVKAPLASSEKDQQTGATSVTPAMKQQKKVAHNAIERRYRNNINDRIAALRNAVPALRELRPRKTPSGRKSRKAQTEEDLVDGVPAATKLNKATILGKATEYIKYLKSRELRLASEVTGLRELVRSLEGGEELLELWESEMEKVVAEQEAAAAATVAKEEEDLGLGLDGEDDDDDVEGEGEEDDGEELDTSSSRRESGANSPSSRASSRPAGRGGGAGSLAGMASSRYMLATFLGVSFLGGGAEFAVDMGASDSVSRVPAGRTVVGASRQLLKRAITHVQVPEEMPEPQPHHLDHVPSHVLVFEILRVVSLAACFFFLIWPLISKIWLARSSGFRQWHQARLEQTRNRKRKALLASLAKSDLEGEEIDAALRTYIGAPRTLLGSLRAMVSDGLTLATHRLGLASVLSSSVVESEDVAIWARLLEVETSLGPSAQPSLVQRIQTVMRVSALTPKLSPLAAADSLEGSARVHATLALACSRIGSEIPFAGDYAEAHWDEARQTIRKDRRRTSVPVEEAGEMDGSDAEGSEADDDDGSSTIGPRASSRDPLSDTWLETVLDLDLDDALDLVASPSEVEVSLSRLGEAKRYQLSPLISIADAFYSRELNMLWSTLFSSITRCTCPGSQPTASLSLSSPSGRDATASPLSTVRSFYRHQMHSHLDLDIIKDAPSRDEMNKRVAMIASSVPKGTTSWILSRVTLATWALALGNLPIASHIAGELLEQREAEGPTTCPSSSPAPTCPVKLSSSAHQLVKLVLGPGTLSETDEPSPLDQADALAASAIAWLDFLRLFKKTTATATSTTTTQRCEARQAIASAAIKVRRLLCKANLPSAYYSEAEEIELQEAKDEMVDILAAIGRRAARVGRSSSAHHTTRRPATSTTHDDDDDDQTKASSFRFWWNDLDSMDVGEGVDSGVELESD